MTRRPVLDFAIIVSLILLPQSYMMYFSSSEFGASVFQRLPLFLIPPVLIGVRLLRPHPRGRAAVDPVVAFLWLAVILQGFLMAMVHTAYRANVLSTYGQYLYWLALVSIFLGCVGAESGLYVLDLMRRYFIFLAAFAWVFVALYLVFGEHLPHTLVVMPDATGDQIVLGQNYYLTVAYSGHDIFGIEVPRFTFLYREPRILGVQLAMALVLQIGYLRSRWNAWTRHERRHGLAILWMIGGALFWTHSLQGYIFTGFVVLALASVWLFGEAFWRNFRLVHLSVVALGVVGLIIAFEILGRRSDLQTVLQVAVLGGYVGDPDVAGTPLYSIIGKTPAVIVEYLAVYLGSPRGLLLFPFGWGIMNLDSSRFMQDYGVPTTGGGTLLQVCAQNAGFAGVIAFGIILWRLFGRMRRVVLANHEPEIRYACLLGGFLLVVSTVYLDLVSWTALVPLVFVSVMRLRYAP